MNLSTKLNWITEHDYQNKNKKVRVEVAENYFGTYEIIVNVQYETGWIDVDCYFLDGNTRSKIKSDKTIMLSKLAAEQDYLMMVEQMLG